MLGCLQIIVEGELDFISWPNVRRHRFWVVFLERGAKEEGICVREQRSSSVLVTAKGLGIEKGGGREVAECLDLE